MKRRVIYLFALALISSPATTSAGLFGDFFTGGGNPWEDIGTPDDALFQLRNGDGCCTPVNHLELIALTPGYNQRLTVNTQRPVVQFKTGKSYALAFALPVTIGPFTVAIDSFAREFVFAPAVVTLDQNYRPVRFVRPNQFKYREAGMMTEDALTYTVNFNGNDQERFLIIFTTNEALNGATQLKHPEKARAEALNLAVPPLEDPLSLHAAIGVLDVKVNSGGSASGFSIGHEGDSVDAFFNDMFAPTTPDELNPAMAPEQAAVMAAKVPDKSPTPGLDPTVTTPSAAPGGTVNAVVAPRGGISMMPETEALYNELIANAVSSNEIDKAMRLVEEAERAGSATARSTFISAVKQLQ
ncbi:hypothetical protein EZV61_12030 [Corallincola luteus]|uniref:Maltose operon protein n=1 Tax=Corallincola luteus TaxID=1775177 RepID=A0ABY2AMZ9_9GAMM|nr:MalM family protein [Corallincola luteus]TCI03003.1 hypothetical protein EZV61_12030 [Corallincola luteus]